MDENTYKPEWAEENHGKDETYASFVMRGVDEPSHLAATQPKPATGPRKMTMDDYVEGVLACDRTILSRAITLVESNAPRHFEMAQELIQRILPYTGRAKRIGISGVPGAGKSTLIEAFGMYLVRQGYKVAVLAVDPSSAITRGAILGDKTRMEHLSKEPNAFIRPSPSGGTLGGVSRKSRETLLLADAAGYAVFLVETVGVGQSEITVRSMVDFFLLVVLTGAGDDLQGVKKGVIEIAEMIMVNKADGDNLLRAQTTRADYEQFLHYLRPATEGWQTKAYTCSAYTGAGIPEMWAVLESYFEQRIANGKLYERRRQQNLDWLKEMTEEYFRTLLYSNPVVAAGKELIDQRVLQEELAPTKALGEMARLIEHEFCGGVAQK